MTKAELEERVAELEHQVKLLIEDRHNMKNWVHKISDNVKALLYVNKSKLNKTYDKDIFHDT